jgi:hypothetical protein
MVFINSVATITSTRGAKTIKSYVEYALRIKQNNLNTLTKVSLDNNRLVLDNMKQCGSALL